MIKKISAIILALVLCLSVVVVPASALESGKEVGYRIELDKEYYSAGDTVTVKLYLDADETKEYGTGAVVFGMSSAVFSTTDNAVATVKASSTGNAAFESFYKLTTASTWSWQTNTTILNNIKTNNTDNENALFDQYLKIVIARNTSGSHDNAGLNTNGLPGADINAETDPFITFQLKVRDDVADGTVINVGVPTGPMAKNYTYMNYYSDPGNSNKVTKTTTATSEVTFSTTSQIGEAVTELSVVPMKQQIKNNADGSFNYRIIAELDNMWEVFADTADVLGEDDGLYISEAGFIYNRNTTEETAKIDVDKALTQINGGTVTYGQVDENGRNLQHQKSAYIQTNYENTVAMACVVYNIPAEDANQYLSVLAYIKYVQGGVEKVAYCDAYTGTFTLYNA